MMNLPEELIYGLIFGAVLIFQYVMKRFAPEPKLQPLSPQYETIPETEEPQLAALDSSPGSRPLDTRFGRSSQQTAAPARGQHRYSRKVLLANRRDVQNSIVVATIIGPCRAFEPHAAR